jgi:hypothetical protein
MTACGPPRGQQLCDAIARRDVATVRRLLEGPEIDLTKAQGTCVPVAAVFGVAKPSDVALTQIGIELVSAGLPANASWYPPDNRARVEAIEAAASNGNAELVRALFAVGLDVKRPEVMRAFMRAVAAGHLPVVKLLVQEGADIEATSGGETAVERARTNGRDEVVQFLEETAAARAPAADPPATDGPAASKSQQP